MSLAVVYSRANIGIDAPLIRVEVHLSNGLPGFSIVGMPETAVKESKERVRSALLNTNLDFPDKKITVNLAPADLPKSGGRYDLAIATGILVASGQLPGEKLTGLELLGELALSGEVRGIVAVIPAVLSASQAARACIVPSENADEAGMTGCANIWSASHLLEVVAFLSGKTELARVKQSVIEKLNHDMDMSDVVGQHVALRAVKVAAAGGHNVLMTGPPGTGKTMLAMRMRTILPELNKQQALEIASVRSIAGTPLNTKTWKLPPFRAPHHTASAVAMVGGGSALKVGEITMAHNGVLFLDELPEFNPKVLDVLREPMESGEIAISRANYQVILPARFQMIAAMNPCPCGFQGDPQKACRCTAEQVRKYQTRISGPLLDRIDIHIQIPRLSREDSEQLLFKEKVSGERSDDVRSQVSKARQVQFKRAGKCNAELNQREIREVCRLKQEDERYLKSAVQQLHLSIRSFYRILKMARTVADLDSARDIGRVHLQEAMGYRCQGEMK